jgi:hypothetical protein
VALVAASQGRRGDPTPTSNASTTLLGKPRHACDRDREARTQEPPALVRPLQPSVTPVRRPRGNRPHEALAWHAPRAGRFEGCPRCGISHGLATRPVAHRTIGSGDLLAVGGLQECVVRDLAARKSSATGARLDPGPLLLKRPVTAHCPRCLSTRCPVLPSPRRRRAEQPTAVHSSCGPDAQRPTPAASALAYSARGCQPRSLPAACLALTFAAGWRPAAPAVAGHPRPAYSPGDPCPLSAWCFAAHAVASHVRYRPHAQRLTFAVGVIACSARGCRSFRALPVCP